MKIFPTLYEQSTTGKTKHWSIEVSQTGKSEATILVKYGAGDSKVKLSKKVITQGKNIGRSNETTPYEQALSEAEATWKKKKDKGYVEDISNLQDEVLLPMLAHTFQKRGHDIVYPCYAQPKLDGVRCLAKKIDDKTIKYYSRMGKEFTTLEHLTEDLLAIMSTGQVFDGEIYSHDHTFQEMIRLVKKEREGVNFLRYCVFDIVDTIKTFEDRFVKDLYEKFDYVQSVGSRVVVICKNPSKNILVVATETVDSDDDIKFLHSKMIDLGFEGLILRNADGKYQLKSRSKDLQKYKEFQDEEFEIVGGQPSTGTEAGCVIFTVKNKKGQQFAVRPRGSFELRKQWMDSLDSLIGKKLTVRYQELTDDGIPRFPVGIGIRDYES